MKFRDFGRACSDATPRTFEQQDRYGFTKLLLAWSEGEAEAGEQLFGWAYPQLHRIARQRLLHAPVDITFGTTDLVHETYLRLVGQTRVRWQSRNHFLAVSTRLIQRVLADHARRRGRRKRGGGEAVHVTLDHVQLTVDVPRIEQLDLNRALELLARINPTAVRIVKLRYSAGLSLDATAKVLGLGRATVVRNWRFARIWLERRLRSRDRVPNGD